MNDMDSFSFSNYISNLSKIDYFDREIIEKALA